jgi:hypothetical protein
MPDTLDERDVIQAVEIDWFAEEAIVRVIPRDRQRFEIQKDKAIRVLQLAQEVEQFQLQFDLLLRRIAEWISEHTDKIERALMTLQDGLFALVIVRKEIAYDEAFQDELADLDIALANDTDLNLIRLKTLALPNVGGDSLRSFLDERLMFEFQHGGRSRSHRQSQP